MRDQTSVDAEASLRFPLDVLCGTRSGAFRPPVPPRSTPFPRPISALRADSSPANPHEITAPKPCPSPCPPGPFLQANGLGSPRGEEGDLVPVEATNPREGTPMRSRSNRKITRDVTWDSFGRSSQRKSGRRSGTKPSREGSSAGIVLLKRHHARISFRQSSAGKVLRTPA